MLESGIVSLKNEVNIMMKNVVDVVLGGLTYWAFGYGLSYGESEYSNGFVAFGNWFVDASGDEMGSTFVTFLFQLSFATTATTIVSGAMAERQSNFFHQYCLLNKSHHANFSGVNLSVTWIRPKNVLLKFTLVFLF
jgi:Amt family ammonium transporter